MWFDGIAFPFMGYKAETLRDVCDNFVIKDEDTILLTYPKSGTHWLIEIVCLIQTKGDPKWVQSEPTWVRSPWLETDLGYSILKSKEIPRFISSHLPFQLFPKSLFSSKAKVIYLIRNPRDVLVSGYFFWSKTTLTKKPESLVNFYEWFIKGNVPYGSWFEHTKGWMSMRDRDNFLLLSYEELKKNPRGMIEKICQFLAKKLEPEELNLVLKYSSFKAMKENDMSNFKSLKKRVSPDGVLLTRKGMVGDWKNHFTVAQAEAFDKIFQEKMKGFPPELFPWE